MLLAIRSGLVSSLKGISGSEARRVSITTKTASRAMPPTIGPSAASVSQPFNPASTTPNTSTIWPIVNVSAPARSKLAPSRALRRSLTTAYATSAVAIAIGGLIKSTQRQLSTSVMIPPSRTPAAPPSPFIAAHRPIARCSCGPGANDEVMIASEHAAIRAPPRPCTARATISISRPGAAPPTSEASPNRSSARTNIRRCPKWSAARPPNIKKPANVIAYASTIHCSSGAENPRFNWIEGSATLTMLRSRITMNWATQQTTRSHAEPEPCLFSVSAGVAAVTPGFAVVSVLMRTENP